MPSLTQRQWDDVRRVAADSARRVVDESFEGGHILNIDFHPSQIAEIQSIAAATARKHLKQKESNHATTRLDVHAKNIDSLFKRADKSAYTLREHTAQLNALQTTVDKLRQTVTRLDIGHATDVFFSSTPFRDNWVKDRLNIGVDGKVHGSTPPRPRMAPGPKNGDRMAMNGETFYFWWGQWRRESEIAGFSNWVTKKALGKK